MADHVDHRVFGVGGGAMNSLRLCIRLNEVVGMGVIKERKFHCYQ